MKPDVRMDNCGFTLLEVLIGSVVFMVGFALVVLTIDSTLVKLSLGEFTVATALAEETMNEAAIAIDTASMDTIIVRSGVAFAVRRQVETDDHRAKILVRVSRAKTGKQLIELYDEYVLANR